MYTKKMFSSIITIYVYNFSGPRNLIDDLVVSNKGGIFYSRNVLPQMATNTQKKRKENKKKEKDEKKKTKERKKKEQPDFEKKNSC